MRLLRFATFVLLFSFTAIVQAAFPDKPIKIIVGFPPGGPLDTHARLLIDQLQKNLGQPVIIDFKPGAGGSIGADFVIKAPADGYTLLMANTGTMVINPFEYIQQGADPAFLDSAQFAQFLQSEGLRWGDAVKKAGVKLD